MATLEEFKDCEILSPEDSTIQQPSSLPPHPAAIFEWTDEEVKTYGANHD
jgi:hypothetical protein